MMRWYIYSTAINLSSLWDFSRSCLLLLWLFFISGFINVPLPCNHGFYRLFDWPAVNFFVLPGREVGSYCWQKNAGWVRVTVNLPSQKRFCKVWASGESLHVHPGFLRMTSCSGSGMQTYNEHDLLWTPYTYQPIIHSCSDQTLLFSI